MTNTELTNAELTAEVQRLKQAMSEVAGELHPGAVAGSLSPFAGGRERARALRQIPTALEISDAQRGPAPLEHRAEGVA